MWLLPRFVLHVVKKKSFNKQKLPYSGSFWGRKLVRISCAKVFSVKFGGVASLVWHKELSANVQSYFSVIHESFLPRKFSSLKVSRYTVSHNKCLPSVWLKCKNYMYHIAGNFWGRKLLRISWICGYSRKFSPWNLEVWHPLAWHKQKLSAKVFSMKSYFSAIHKSFLPRNFPAIRYHIISSVTEVLNIPPGRTYKVCGCPQLIAQLQKTCRPNKELQFDLQWYHLFTYTSLH